ncbi:MAG: AAA family ATPase [Anaplasmataceae bacterium]|nr:AAA family ATPase [Anaplasmataceae bacterium]
MILVVGNIKGGVGKTTLAVNIAIARVLAGRDVLLVDGDEQRTATIFTDLRTEQVGRSGYTSVSLQGVALRTQVRQLTGKYQDIVIDVGGRDTGSLRAALTIAETVLIPVQPRSFDIWAIDHMAMLVKEAQEINDLRAIIVLNAADTHGKDNEEARQVLSEVNNIEILPIKIGRRKAYPNAASTGRSVLEHVPIDMKATDELTALIGSLYDD